MTALTATERKRNERSRRKALKQRQVWLSPIIFDLVAKLDELDCRLNDVCTGGYSDNLVRSSIKEIEAERIIIFSSISIHLASDIKG